MNLRFLFQVLCNWRYTHGPEGSEQPTELVWRTSLRFVEEMGKFLHLICADVPLHRCTFHSTLAKGYWGTTERPQASNMLSWQRIQQHPALHQAEHCQQYKVEGPFCGLGRCWTRSGTHSPSSGLPRIGMLWTFWSESSASPWRWLRTREPGRAVSVHPGEGSGESYQLV